MSSFDRIAGLRKEAGALLNKAQAVYERKNASNAEIGQADSWSAEAREISERAFKLKEVSALHKEMEIPEVQPDESEPASATDKGGFKNFGEFVKAVRETAGGSRDTRLRTVPRDKKDMAEGAMATGGALVPPGFVADLLVYEAENAIVQPRARVITITGRDFKMPAVDHTGGSPTNTPFFGNLEAKWGEEAGLKTESDLDLKMIELVAHKLYVYTRCSDELVSDSSPSVSETLSYLFGGKIGHSKDYCFLRGNGVGQPLGIVGHAATFTQVRAVANNFGYVDAVNMWTHFMPAKEASCAWVMSIGLKAEMATMVSPANDYIWSPNAPASAVNRPPGTLLGYPVIFTEKLPALGTTGDVLLCDFSQYLVGQRLDMSFDVSTHERFQYDQTAYRSVSRCDGQIWLQETILTMDAVQVSPFVELDAATS